MSFEPWRRTKYWIRNATHAKVRKRRRGWRRAGILWDFNGDGRFPSEHLSGWWKRYWRKWRQRHDQQTVHHDLRQEHHF